jgi:hypothetical protein
LVFVCLWKMRYVFVYLISDHIAVLIYELLDNFANFYYQMGVGTLSRMFDIKHQINHDRQIFLKNSQTLEKESTPSNPMHI